MAVRIPDCVCVGETAKAILVRTPDNGEVWIPQSQVDDDSEVWKRGTEGVLVVTDWIAEQKELEGE